MGKAIGEKQRPWNSVISVVSYNRGISHSSYGRQRYYNSLLYFFTEPLHITAMANRITKPMNKGKANIPPKRGQIKVKIIGNCFKTVIAVASKAVRELRRKKNEGGGGSSALTTPPPSTYTSDWHSDI
ncbi:hypothetical protein HHK36_018967 [Tetracentron sinense]|uniref:Uncharacterized protein n=1 Tax=Tetracentron sinense TaxID=13715 RepID=A0A835D8R1_TETSI|nr:hypothetical protein HHK36_018967 [Tetracentron sinense]